MENGQRPSPALEHHIFTIARKNSPESIQNALAFKPRRDDIILASGTKCGTTWMQQVMHGLRSNGDMSFEEITSVMPIIEKAYDTAVISLDDEQGFQPRMFRTHFRYDECPKGAGKYIFITRDPVDAAVSQYCYHRNWLFDADEIDLDEFVIWIWTKHTELYEMTTTTTPQMDHQASWYPHRNDPNVLWLHFEDMKQNLRECIKLVSDFLQIGVGDAALLKLVEEQASLDFMKKHPTKFDGHPNKVARNEAIGRPKYAGVVGKGGGAVGKVREGNVSDGRKQLSPETVKLVNDRWKQVVGAVSGYSCYEDMRAGINRELRRNFD